MEKFFNTAGPIVPEDHYCLDPLKRIDMDEMMTLIAKKRYFILHAPRQTGKTTSLLALRNEINNQGRYKCLYVNIETAQTARGDVSRGMKAILASLNSANSLAFDDDFFYSYLLNGIDHYGEDSVLMEALSQWSRSNTQKTILLIDETDALVGDTLISLLRQLRAGYAKRPDAFPLSIILCGVRDVRDYRIFSARDQQMITGGSAFNIKAKSLTVGNFDREEIRLLYGQHTEETGQVFEEGVFDLAWDYTEGQPWLVNALAYEACFENKDGRNRSLPITAHMFERAKEALVIRRDTHIDQLADKLKEDRVRRVIEPILKGTIDMEDISEDDILYCEDLGLIKRKGSLDIANGIYREVIPRTLSYATQRTIYKEPQWYVDDDGTLNMPKLLADFQQFFREQSESWLERFQYREAGPQLLLQAFLQRIINGGGLIDREYGLGRKRTDLYIRWPVAKSPVRTEAKDYDIPFHLHPEQIQRIVIELKLKHKSSREHVIEEGLMQTAAYAGLTGAKEAYLIIFDQDNQNWEEKVFMETRIYKSQKITVFGM